MLEKREYTITELEKIINSTGKQAVDRKLRSRGVQFTSTGRGKNRIYTITQIPDPFKMYAIVKLGIPAQADFTKIRNIYYYLLCGEGFAENPLIEMERILEADGNTVRRQTISKWINYLRKIDYITYSASDFTYYVIRKLSNGEKEYEEIDAGTYKKGWAIYHHWKSIEGSKSAYSRMYNTINGHPYKRAKIIENAIYLDEINELIDMINNSFLDNQKP